MYISFEQLQASLDRLKYVNPFFGMSFLAFKKAQLPVGKIAPVTFSKIAVEFLLDHHRISLKYDRFYSPYRSSKGSKGGYWVAPRYPSTSLQRITADTFGHAFIHPKASSFWGWAQDYVEKLKQYLEENGGLLPAFDMAVWLYRTVDIGTDTPSQLQERFFQDYHIEHERVLFDSSSISHEPSWLVDTPLTEHALLDHLGRPDEGKILTKGREEENDEKNEAAKEKKWAALWSLELEEVGPSPHVQYEPSSRLNLIVGDNALGKTFLLDCAYYALTGEWPDHNMPGVPRLGTEKARACIRSNVATDPDTPNVREARYDIRKQQWTYQDQPEPFIPGIVVYARHDGSFTVWDSATPTHDPSGRQTLFLNAKEVITGVGGQDPRDVGGLRSDWIAWGSSEQSKMKRRGLEACVQSLSPDPKIPLQFGEPVSVQGLNSDIPTLKMRYGPVPIVHASAGIRRMLAIAYMLVWSWQRYERSCAQIEEKPSRRIILLCDELEAHLHPRWQRRIIPALLDALNGVILDAEPQLHVATHSPLVMASAETSFDVTTDRLHHLYLSEDEDNIEIEILDFVKQGRVDRWLTSIFELGEPRSMEGEMAIDEAREIQRPGKTITPEGVLEVHAQLLRALGPRDEYWVHWLGFARKHGVDT